MAPTQVTERKTPKLDLGFPLFLQKMEATAIEDPGTKEKTYAYEITFVAVIPEGMVRFLVNYLREHKVHIKCVDPNDLKGE